MKRQIDSQTDRKYRQMDGWTDRQMNGQTDSQAARQTDRQSVTLMFMQRT